MITWLQAALLGLVEGLTEYLPVSSTGHLILANRFLGIAETGPVKAFDIVIQAGAILAVLGLYRGRVAQMLRGLAGKDLEGRTLVLNLLAACAPALAIGGLVGEKVKDLLFGAWPVVAALAVGAVLMLAAEPLRKRRAAAGGAVGSLTLPAAVTIGCLQCLALWPGTSRSMVTILGGLLVGLTPAAAAEFSFLLALPTLGAATAHQALKHHRELMDGIAPLSMAIGLSVALVSAALAVKALVAWLTKHGFVPFAIYRLALAGVVAWVLLR